MVRTGLKVASNGLSVAVVAAVFAGAIYASYQQGVPTKLPGAAFGWTFLFHVLRASALLGALGLVLLVGWRGLRGEFPIKFGNVEYAVKEAAAQAGTTSDAQERRIQLLEAILEIGPPPPPP